MRKKGTQLLHLRNIILVYHICKSTIWGRVSQNSNLFLEGAQRKKEMQKCREYLYKLDIFLKKADRVLSNYYEQILIVSYFVKADLLRDHTPEESAHGL